jgi:hypothetical protein
MSHAGLFLGGKPLIRRPAPSGSALAQLRPLEWSLYLGHIYFRGEKDKLPRDYELYYTALPVGVTLYDVHDVILSDLVIQGFQLDGVNAHDNVFQTSLVGLTCRGNGRSGISVGGASRLRVHGCVLAENGTAQVRTEGPSQTEVSDCQISEATAPAIVREGGLITKNP